MLRVGYIASVVDEGKCMGKKVKSFHLAMQALRGPGELRLLVFVTTAL